MARDRSRAASPPPPAASPSRHRKWLWIGCACSAVVAVVAWLRSLSVPFVYDDLRVIVENPSIRSLANPRFVALYFPFRPLLNFSYAVDFRFWQLNPLGYHATSILLHAVNTALVGALASVALTDLRAQEPEKQFVPWLLVLLPAAVFAVHPLFTEAVAYVTGRSEVLCASAFLSGFLCARNAIVSGRFRWLGLAAILFVLAAATKETAAVFPIVLCAYDFLAARARDSRASWRRRLLFAYLPLTFFIAAGGVYRMGSLLSKEGGLPRPIGQNLLMQFDAIWKYLALWFWPANLSLVHEVPNASSIWSFNTVEGVGLLICVALSWRASKRMPLVAFGTTWFFAVIFVSSGLIPLLEPMAEHRAYLASVGLGIASLDLVLLAVRALDKAKRWDPSYAPLAVLGIVGLLAVLTWNRVGVWENPVALWADAVEKAPRVWTSRYGYADSLRTTNRCADAVPQYQEAVRLLPGEVRARVNLGICLGQLGRVPEAKAAFEGVLTQDPNNVKAFNNLGTLAMISGDGQGARRYFERALALDPNDERARQSLKSLP